MTDLRWGERSIKPHSNDHHPVKQTREKCKDKNNDNLNKKTPIKILLHFLSVLLSKIMILIFPWKRFQLK